MPDPSIQLSIPRTPPHFMRMTSSREVEPRAFQFQIGKTGNQISIAGVGIIETGDLRRNMADKSAVFTGTAWMVAP